MKGCVFVPSFPVVKICIRREKAYNGCAAKLWGLDKRIAQPMVVFISSSRSSTVIRILALAFMNASFFIVPIRFPFS